MAYYRFRLHGVRFTDTMCIVDCQKFRYTNTSGLSNTLKKLGLSPRQIAEIIKTAKAKNLKN